MECVRLAGAFERWCAPPSNSAGKPDALHTLRAESSQAWTGRGPYGPAQGVLRFVIFGQQVDVIGTRTIKVLLCLNILQDNAHTVLLPFMGYPQRLCGNCQFALRQSDLLGY